MGGEKSYEGREQLLGGWGTALRWVGNSSYEGWEQLLGGRAQLLGGREQLLGSGEQLLGSGKQLLGGGCEHETAILHWLNVNFWE